MGTSFILSANALYADSAAVVPPDSTSIQIGGFAVNGIIDWIRNAIDAVIQWQEKQFAESVAIYTVGALIVASYFLPRISRAGVKFWKFQRRVRAARELKHEEHQMAEIVAELCEDIGKELKLLQEIGRHRALYPDERYLRTKLTQYQKTLKEVISRGRRRESD